VEELKSQAEALGIKVDGRWSEDRLREEIEAVQAAKAATSPVEPAPEAPQDPAKPEPEPEPEPEPQTEGEANQAYSGQQVTVSNLKANPMKSLGLESYGTATFTETQLAIDPSIEARILRGVELGILRVE